MLLLLLLRLLLLLLLLMPLLLAMATPFVCLLVDLGKGACLVGVGGGGERRRQGCEGKK